MPFGKKKSKPKTGTTVKVIVPANLGPDRQILVETPDGRRISAVVPKECAVGSTILVQVPPQTATAPPQPKQPSPLPPQIDRVQKIKVPEGKRRKGEKFRVVLPDGRSIMATVPYNGCKEFSLDTSTLSKQQRQQNWHDSPLAVAPMFVGPFL